MIVVEEEFVGVDTGGRRDGVVADWDWYWKFELN